ncbi:alanine racemase [Geomonas nitrogeniifigens]|uniref:alanine racemase n=1 Tax=Geomonas diazotrophica TaxID=2843197 RepID=UPI001C2C212C|nr:alanine racemase [Geomonas nitrogeniifigens]QXE85027.1 alanine racemase [Geomonas nitrogeniifigens]
MAWTEAEELSKQYGDPFFVYDEGRFIDNFKRMDHAFKALYGQTQIAYSYKTNYTPDICKLVDQLGGYAEVVSEMEYNLACRLGVLPERIVYNGPYKSFDSIRAALLSGALVNLDSIRDLNMAVATSLEASTRVINVAIRCNFPIDDNLQSRFGFDVGGEEFRHAVQTINNSPNLRLAGLHCHFPNRDLSSYAVRVERMIELCQNLFSEPPDFINIGGGYFGNMPDKLKMTYKFELPNFSDYAKVICTKFARAFEGQSKKPLLFIEPGTALVADTFKFYTKIINIKNINGRRIVNVSGSIFNISPVARSLNLPVSILNRDASTDVGEASQFFDVTGFTCIESDYLSKSVKGYAEVGDFIVYENVGSYSIVMKPPFILPNCAIIKKVEGGGYSVVRTRETSDYIFKNFVSY